MPHDGSSDFEKLTRALESLTGVFGSVDNFLAAFGLANMPTAQRYGILFGICVFTLTLVAVITLLIMGGTFTRMAEQAKTAGPTVPDAITARRMRALLFERLLEARDRMLKENYTPTPPVNGLTKLTQMLLNVSCKDVADLVAEDASKRKAAERYIPLGYQENYRTAYLTCQDKPGGKIHYILLSRMLPLRAANCSALVVYTAGATIPGRPEARFEAYARAYAGCGVHPTTEYRRSYARLYEAMACQSRHNDDIFGRTVRLEALEKERHLQVVHDITCGLAYLDGKAFDANKVWAFRTCGPFNTPEQLAQSEVFQLQANEAAFAIVENLTERVIGVIHLTNDDPKNLSIQIEMPIIKPSSEESQEQMEACFLLMDRLFAFGYRRIQVSLDSQDTNNKNLALRLGFTQEGYFPKHMIVKNANRDSWVYGMINSDWQKGARSALFKKLHGATMQKADSINNAKEGELEQQQIFLKEKKKLEAAQAQKKNA
jgi:RimJ/RimL family protein N-acetyltransferase